MMVAPDSADIATADGARLTATSPGYCKAACESGLLAFCQFAIVPNDVSVGLLSMITQIAAKNDTTTHVIKIEDVVRDFNVNNALQPCPRGDVVVDHGKVLNSGKQCLSAIGPRAQGSVVRASLSTSQNVVADVSSSPGLALFPDTTSGFELSFDDANLQRNFGGPISVAAQTAMKADIAVTIKRDADKPPCADIRADVVRQTDFYKAVKIATANAALVAKALDDLEPFMTKAAANKKAPDDAQTRASLAPLTDEYHAMLEALDSTDKTRVQALGYTATAGTLKGTLKVEHILMLQDVHLCHKQLVSAGMPGPEHFYPPIDPNVPLSVDSLADREKQAGRYLLCRFGYEQFPEALKNVLTELERRLVK
jgi:hypothetical protein